jgi:hypothetical protein
MSIRLTVINKKPRKRWNVLSVEGEIQINDFIEGLYIPLDWWSIDDYLAQWNDAMQRLQTYSTSCFVVTIHNPSIRPFIDWWLLYKIGDKIYIHNQWIFDEIYREFIGNKPFTRENCYDFIPEYHTDTEDGNKASEWVIDWKKTE